jgi:hypothetical protein
VSASAVSALFNTTVRRNTTVQRNTTVRRLVAFAAASTVAMISMLLCATPASAHAKVGYVRLAHLSPDTPDVDVYLSSQSGAIKEQVFKGVGYGVLSAYEALPVGGYTVAMRKSGAKKSDPAVLTTQVSVTADHAYTVAGVGRYADLGLRVLNDDLALPAKNRSKVRIVQGSVRAPVLSVGVDGGSNIASNVAFATTTDYQIVDPGNWRLVITPASGAAPTDVAADLGEGSVYSLLILDKGTSGLEARLVTDATRRGGVPVGGVNTGAGGTATAVPVIQIAILLILGSGAAVAFIVYRRRRSRLV